MRFPRIFRRNRRWARQVDAYVDHRLTPVERELFEVRATESESVRQLLEQTETLKSALGDMPEFAPARSFVLTPAMVAEPAPQPSRGPAVTMRLAQATSFAAVAAFGIIFAFDTVGTNSDDSTAGTLAHQSEFSDDGMRTTGANGAEDDDSAVGSSLTEPPGVAEAGPAGDLGVDDASGDSFEPVSALYDPSGGVDAGRSLLPVYSALGAVFLLAVGAWAVARHQVQRAQRI